MAAAISFYGRESTNIYSMAGSGIGFFGAGGFGTSVAVGAYQLTSYITSADGSIMGPEINNVVWTHPNSGIVGQVGPSLPLTYIPNNQATLNIRFTFDSICKVQNAQLRIYDRFDIDNPASGVLTQCAELIHPNSSQIAGGSGDTAWNQPAGNSSIMNLVGSPGSGGLSPSGL